MKVASTQQAVVRISWQAPGVFAVVEMEIAAALPLGSQAEHCRQVGVFLRLPVVGVLPEPLEYLEASGENTEGMY